MTNPKELSEARMEKRPRHWFIQKPTAHNCPLAIKGAVFEELMPTVVKHKCEWIKVFSADDIQARLGMSLTRYMFIMDENHDLMDENHDLMDENHDLMDENHDLHKHIQKLELIIEDISSRGTKDT